MSARAKLVRAGFALVIGSMAAPVIYVLVGYTIPLGFHDLRSASSTAVIAAFGTAWFFSSVLTLVVGGVAWQILHARGIDGFISYSVIAVISFAALYVLSSPDGSSLSGASFGAGLATTNAVLVRAIELLLRAKSATAERDVASR